MDTVKAGDIDQILWPDHCVQASEGAGFHPELDQRYINLVLHKGTKKDLDSYSAFFENDHKTATGLEGYLRSLGFDELYICGLATDVCVYFSAMDARKLGYTVHLVTDAVRGIDQPKGSLQEKLDEMQQAGVLLEHSSRLLSPEAPA